MKEAFFFSISKPRTYNISLQFQRLVNKWHKNIKFRYGRIFSFLIRNTNFSRNICFLKLGCDFLFLKSSSVNAKSGSS